MEKDNSRIFGYDLIKTIAIFMIVCYHLGGVDYGEVIPGEYYLPNTAKFFSAFMAASVPLFLMVNGALIIPRNLAFQQLAIRTARLLLLYIFWKFTLQDLLCRYCFGIREEMIHFWYLRALAGTYILHYFLVKFARIRVILLILLFICPFLTNLVGDIVAFVKPNVQLPAIAHTGLFSLYTIFYFFIGCMLKDSCWRYSVCVISILIGVFLVNFEVVSMSYSLSSVFDCVNAAFPTIGALAMSVGFFQLLKKANTAVNHRLFYVINLIGRNTLGIFLFHVPILFLSRKYIFADCNYYDGYSFCILLSITLFISLFISYSIGKSPLRFLVGH